MSKGLIDFAAGLGSGYLTARQRTEDQARIDEDRTMRKQEFDARMEELNSGKQQRISLANAAAPLKVTEVTDIDPNNPSAPRKTSYSLSDGRVLGSKDEADAAAVDYNKPEAQTQRIATAYRTSGAPEKAMTLENAALTQKRTQEQYTQEQKDRAKQLQQEGVFSAVRAFRAGDASGLLKAFNEGGDYKMDGDPTISQEVRDIPGIGRVTTYNAKLRIVGPDGKVQEKMYNSHDVSMSLLPFEKALEFQAKGTKAADDAAYKSGMLGATQKNADASMLRAQRSGGGEGGGSKAPSGYRFAADGKTLEAIPGGPADKPPSPGKPLPISAANGVLTNQQNLRRAQNALALVSGKTVDGAPGDTDATGKKGWLPNQILNRIDPAGVDTRAAIADLGSLVIHDRSGAAVTAAEFPRLAPFIPTEKDDPATVKKKLSMFTKNYQAIIDDQTEFFRSSGYNVPVEKLKSGGSDPQPKPAAQMPRIATPADAMKLAPGTMFIDANGVTRRRP